MEEWGEAREDGWSFLSPYVPQRYCEGCGDGSSGHPGRELKCPLLRCRVQSLRAVGPNKSTTQSCSCDVRKSLGSWGWNPQAESQEAELLSYVKHFMAKGTLSLLRTLSFFLFFIFYLYVYLSQN